ncbi:hypothetical protein SAMN05660841_02285 [Sphingobacterium nematocida]|uniref:DUF2116 family Zn-ribbon domain-containing protein n=1 Tax=Sphingobacterium nematocida TaxID=1513896 RepID=A0A1T5E0K0_9SPHI|nr:hypothetical protein [Sphingobacterium nematocida]SKB77286.1 hypothetical protein SAMN05660841_02285 [Sphingobacterium nematocida]
MENKRCLECLNPIKGRSDKRFCNDSCRGSYNNRLKTDNSNIVRKINKQLYKNRKILSDLLREDKMIKVNEDRLITKGFDLEYRTHELSTSKGQTYFFVYEYGYLPLENQQYLIVKNKNLI